LTLFICVLHSTILLLATTSDCLSYALHFPSFSGWNNFFGVHANWNATLDGHWGIFFCYSEYEAVWMLLCLLIIFSLNYLIFSSFVG